MEQASVLYSDGWVFQEDNDPKHTSKVVKGFMQDRDISRMDWPACSPDMNPIENIGRESREKSISSHQEI